MTFLKSTAYVLAANFLVLALGFFLRPVTARFLGPSEYGLFALVLSTATVIPALTLFSLNSGVLYFTAKKPQRVKQLVSTSLAFTIAAAAILSLPLQFVVLSAAPALGPAGYAASFFLSIALCFFLILQAAQQGLEKFGVFSKYAVASAFFSGILSLALAYATADGVLSAWGRALAIVAVSAAGLFSLKALGRPSMAELKKILAYAAPLGLVGFVGAFIVVVDRYLIAAFRGVSEVGYYDISYSLVAAVLPFSTSLFTTMMPRVIRQESKLKFYYEKISQANTMLLATAGIVFFYYSDIIVSLLLGQNFAGAVTPLKILSLTLPLMAIHGLNFSSTSSVGRTKIAGLLISLLTVFSLVFNVILVPLYGAVGASWANVLTYIFTSSIGFYYLKTRYGVEIRQVLPQYFIFILFIALYVFFFEGGGFVGKTLALAVYALLTYLANKQLVHETVSRIPLGRLKIGRSK